MMKLAAISDQFSAQNQQRASRGFTLVELLIAILVLIVVIMATARIFGTASQVAGLGHASAAVLQEAAAIERQLRKDIERLSHEGFFAIRQVAVRNDINLGSTGALLNPNLPDNAIIRADQLVFFANGVESMQTAGIADGYNVRGQGVASRVYYGHAFQLPNGRRFEIEQPTRGRAHDPGPQGNYPGATSNFRHVFDMTPWHAGPIWMTRTLFNTGAGTDTYSRAGSDSIEARQPDALQWLLARQAVMLVDDDREVNPDSNRKTVYLGDNRTARSIFIDHPGWGFTREIRNGRLDGAASRPEDIRRYVQWRFSDDVRRPWNDPTFGGGVVNADQRSIIASAIYYPRAERHAPSMHRVDQALTNHVIGSAVSSFIIEWTWENGTGEVRNREGDLVYDPVSDSLIFGFRANCYEDGDPCFGEDQPEHPWFGLNNWLPGMPGEQARGVGFYGFDDSFQQPQGVPYREVANFYRAHSILATNAVAGPANNDQNNVERFFGPGTTFPYNVPGGMWVYEAIFGYNRDQPLNRFGELDGEMGYTPWPSAIRVTLVMHDPNGKLENGREFQFVIDLPRRSR